MNRTVLCFGSDNKGDDLAWKICDSLKGKIKNADILKCDSPFEIKDYIKNDRLVIVDVVKGINKTRVFTDLEDFRVSKKVTTHDIDLTFILKILENVRNCKFKIIGVPWGKKKDEVLNEIKDLISSA